MELLKNSNISLHQFLVFLHQIPHHDSPYNVSSAARCRRLVDELLLLSATRNLVIVNNSAILLFSPSSLAALRRYF